MGTIYKDKQLLSRKPMVRLKDKALLRILAQQNKSQTDFAVSLEISPQYFWLLLRGKRNPSASMRAKIMHNAGSRIWDELFEFLP